MKTENIKRFIRSGTEPFDGKNILKMMFLVAIPSTFDIFIWRLIDGKHHGLRLTFLVLYVFWAIFLLCKNSYEEKSFSHVRFLYDGIAWLFLTVLGLSNAYIFLEGTMQRNVYAIYGIPALLCIVSILTVKRCNKVIEEFENQKKNASVNPAIGMLGGVVGILFMRIFAAHFSQNALLVIVACMFVLLMALFTLGFTILFYKAYLVRKHNIDED